MSEGLPVQVPVRLKRIEPPAAADAVLVAGTDVRALAATARGVGPAGVFRIDDGFVIVLKAPSTEALPGIRLRRAGGDFYLPVDAAVIPALLPDEIVGLTRDRGLVALPGGRFLAFDPHSPLPPHAWLGTTVWRDAWQPFPARPVRPDRLTTIERPAPPAEVAEILADGKPNDAEPLPGAGSGSGAGAAVPDDARPATGSGLASVTAAAALGMGQFLTWLGRTLKAPGLAKAGAKLARKAVEQVPRLTEKIFGAQEAALREVLRQLQSGDVEKGLRRAPIAVPDPEAPGRVDTGSRLADRDPRFSLRDLLGGGSGTAGTWLGGGDVWFALAAEYRRLAAEAVRRGDFRRAAYLYGVLLRDVRTAANVLVSGGHFRDAALLFRDKVKDHAAAASAFEKAGDIDEAVRLLDGLGMFEPAGDLLLRAGDVERAHDRFGRAADRLARDGRWLAAGDLVRRKAGDRAGAIRYYQTGWDGRGAESVSCAERLVDEHFLAEDWAAADALFDRAERYLAPPQTAEAGRLFNYALTVGQDFLPADRREALADRTRLVFARHLRADARNRGSQTAADLFGRGAPWPGPVVRDAAYAARQGDRRRPASVLPLDAPPVRLTEGTTEGVVVACESRDLIVATTRAIVCWRADGRVVSIYHGAGREVLGLSADPGGRMVFVLFAEDERVYLTSYVANGAQSFSRIAEHEVAAERTGRDRYHLLPAAYARHGDVRITLWSDGTRQTFAGPHLRPRASGGGQDSVLRVVGEYDVWDWDGQSLRWMSDEGRGIRWPMTWRPGIPDGSPLTVPAVDWLTPSPRVLQIAGTDCEGVVHWSKFDAHRTGGPAESMQTASLTHPAGFLAVCLERPGHLVAATATNEVHWLRVGGKGFEPRTAARTLSVPARVVALATRRAGEGVVAVLEDGSAVVVHRPPG